MHSFLSLELLWSSLWSCWVIFSLYHTYSTITYSHAIFNYHQCSCWLLHWVLSVCKENTTKQEIISVEVCQIERKRRDRRELNSICMAEGPTVIDVYLLYSWILDTHHLSSLLCSVHPDLNHKKNIVRPLHHSFSQINMATTVCYSCSSDGIQYYLRSTSLLILYISNDLRSLM